MLKNSLFQPSLSFSFSTAPFFLFLLQRPFFPFFLSGQRAVSSFSSASLFFSLDVLPFFSPSVEPKTFFSSAQHHRFSLFLFCFSLFFFLLVLFSAHLFFFCSALFFFFLFQRLILCFLPTSKAKNILFRCFTFLLFE